jgi:hypothetical protein
MTYPTVFSDSFDRADANPIGGSYLKVPHFNNCQIVSNHLMGTSADYTASMVCHKSKTYKANQWNRATFGRIRDRVLYTDFGILGLRVNRKNGSGYYAHFFTDTVIFYYIDNTNFVWEFATASVFPSIMPGDLLEFNIVGSKLTAWSGGMIRLEANHDIIKTGVPAIGMISTHEIVVADNWNTGNIII